MKFVNIYFVIMIIGMVLLTGCQRKSQCQWCGEIEYCEEYTMEYGDTLCMCDDCIDEVERAQ